jgi:hypothetical protein
VAKKKQQSVQDLTEALALGYRSCDWNANGERCRFPGTISPSTNGENAQWFCSQHFGCSDPVVGADVLHASMDYKHPTRAELEDEQQRQVRASLKADNLHRRDEETMRQYTERLRLAARRSMRGIESEQWRGLNWAQRIQERVRAGESMPLLAIANATEALRHRASTTPVAEEEAVSDTTE